LPDKSRRDSINKSGMKIIRVAALALSLMLSAGGADAEHEKSIEDGFRHANSNRNVTGGRQSVSRLYEWVNLARIRPIMLRRSENDSRQPRPQP
jgi:hypothetical protein